MTAVFLKLVNMSIAAGFLVLAVIVIRLFLKKAPKWVYCVLWGLVGIRLICPLSVESIFSLIPSAETIPQEIVHAEKPSIHSGVAYLNSYVNPIISEKLAPTAEAGVSPMQTIVFAATVIWLVGLIIMVCYGAISYLRLYRLTCEGMPLYKVGDGNILLCDHISTPFILGVFMPRICLPSNMNETDMEFVIAHERAHLKRHDHWWKPMGFVLLTVYWFNPVMWVAYILLCRDIELACDERVIRDLGIDSKKPYLETLINCSASKRVISACPLAFGEVGVERRVKNVLHYKKPAFWVLVAGVVACIVAAVCFLTNPVEQQRGLATEDVLGSLLDNLENGTVSTNISTDLGMRIDAIEYVYRDSPDFFMPKIKMYMKDNSFSFCYSGLSSYWPYGSFEMTDTQLVLIAGAYGEAKRKYVFQKEGDNYIFVEDRSTSMPNYNYGGNEKRTQPVPDGAVFEPAAIHLTVDEEPDYSAIIDSMLADIDQDGNMELCTLSYGPTSGLFTFKFSIKEYASGKQEYFNIFYSTFYELAFHMDFTGTFYLSGKKQNGEEAYMLKITFEDGNIVLTPDEDSKGVLGYWGEQGIDSEWAR